MYLTAEYSNERLRSEFSLSYKGLAYNEGEMMFKFDTQLITLSHMKHIYYMYETA